MGGIESNRLERFLRQIDDADTKTTVLDAFAKESDIIGGTVTQDSFNMALAVASAGSPIDYIPFVTVPDTPYVISRMIFGFECSGTPASGGFGTLNNPLTNGLEFHFTNKGFGTLAGGIPIKKMGEFALFMHDMVLHNWGQGNQFLTARWTFTRGGQGLYVDPRNGDKMCIRLKDDMTGRGLVSFACVAHGYFLNDEDPSRDIV